MMASLPPQLCPAGQVSTTWLTSRSQTTRQLLVQSPMGKKSQVRPPMGSLYEHTVPPGQSLLLLQASPVLPLPDPVQSWLALQLQLWAFIPQAPVQLAALRQPGSQVPVNSSQYSLAG